MDDIGKKFDQALEIKARDEAAARSRIDVWADAAAKRITGEILVLAEERGMVISEGFRNAAGLLGLELAMDVVAGVEKFIGDKINQKTGQALEMAPGALADLLASAVGETAVSSMVSSVSKAWLTKDYNARQLGVLR
jgi:hypothetical protein